ENVAPLNFRNTISAHSSITVFGIAEDGQKNGIPMAGAPAPKPTFLKMHNYQSNGMISHFNGMKNHAYWICTRINK
nr:hypothetical protein [Citrobacter sedlakii]